MTAINGSTPMPAQTMLPGQQGAGLNVPGGTDPSAYVPGVTVTGPDGGSSTLPSAPVGAYSSPETDPGAQPDKTYPTLLTAHVLMLTAMGTPQELIAQLAAEQPDPGFVEDYLLNQVMPNPEAWDARCGNDPGTARAGLAQLFPDVYGDPSQYQTSNETTPEGENTVTTPGATFEPPKGGLFDNGWVAGGGAALVLGGTGYLAYRSIKKRNEGKEAAAGKVDDLANQLRGITHGGGAADAAGGVSTNNRLRGILALDSRKGSITEQLRNFQAGDSLKLDEHPMLNQLAALNGDAKRPVGLSHPVGLAQADVIPHLEVGKRYGLSAEHMLKFGMVNSSLGGLASDDLARVLGTIAKTL